MHLSIRNYRRGPYFLYNAEDQTFTEKLEPVPIPNKWLQGDLVDPHTNKTTRTQTQNHNSIVGIVDYMNRTGQGFTSRNVPLYMFHPINPAYPPMIVSSKTNPKHNELVTVNLEHWLEKWPRAGIQKVLGQVGNIEAEINAQIHAAAIGKPQPEATDLPTFSNDEHQQSFVFNIDPVGCEDVDDVIIFKQIEDGYEFGIGIADVAAWFTEESAIDEYAKQLAQTMYIDGKPIKPMLPPILSTDRASMRSDKVARPVLSRIYTIKQNKCTDVRWEKQMLKVNRSYTYDSVLEDVDIASKLRKSLEIIYGQPSDDTHRWIEIAMILYNAAAAEVLKENKVGLLRAQPAGFAADEWKSLAEKTGVNDLAFFGFGSGKYVPSTVNEADQRHTGLNLDAYAHASSPLRRYADLHNQRWLKHILFGDLAPKAAANWHHLNERARTMKHLDREVWFLRNLNPGQITTVEGFVIKKKQEDEWQVYIPCWKRKVNAKIQMEEKNKEGKEGNDLGIGSRVQIRAYRDLNSVTCRTVCLISLSKI
jgi:exoribonuclease R